MNKIYTDIEQSQKLVELGIDVNTADMHYYKNSFGDYIEGLYNSSDLKEGFELKGIEYIPAWSLSALLELTPNDVSLLHFEDVYQAVYDVKPYYITNRYDNPLDAAFEMVVWLLENNKI